MISYVTLRDFIRNNCRFYGFLVTLGSALMLIGFVLLGIFVHGYRSAANITISDSESCGTFPALTTFTATKDIWSLYHWKYNFDEFPGYAQQVCPTMQHDAVVHTGSSGQLVARSDGKIATIVSTVYIRDCHGNIKFIQRTGGIFETIINSNKILVSYELQDAQGSTIAYTDEVHFVLSSITLYDISGVTIATMSRTITDAKWVWTYNIVNMTHPAANPEILVLITMQRSFAENPNDTDGCNTFFGVIEIIFIIFLVVGFVLIAWGLYAFVQDSTYLFCRRSSDQIEFITPV